MQTITEQKRSTREIIEMSLGSEPARSSGWQTLLDRERTRADRHGSPLAIVAVEAINGSNTQAGRQRLGNLIDARIRATDESASAPDNRLFLLLPHTNAAGAQTLARDLLQLSARQGLTIRAESFSYPSAGGDSLGARDARKVPTALDPRTLPRRWESSDGLGLSDEQLHTLDGSHELTPLLVRRLPRWKRAMDIPGALAGLLVLWPIFLMAALLIRLTSRGPVLFRQQRSGAGGVPFTMLKFRTMVVDAEKLQEQLKPLSEQDGPAFKMKHDPRVTRIGAILRTTSIDELPQLWNVLKGEMSLVGPRPLPVNQMAECDPWHRRRLDVTPGLTCTWQATARSQVSFDEWARMDTRYARTHTFWGDLIIILRTIPAVLMRRGAK